MSKRHVEPGYFYARTPEDLLYDAQASVYAKVVYAALDRHGQDPENCYPSRARLARLLGVSDASVKRALGWLVEAGWVDEIPRFKDSGEQTSNGYRLYTRPRASDGGGVSQTPPPGSHRPQGGVSQTHEREQENESQLNESPAPSSQDKGKNDGNGPQSREIARAFYDHVKAKRGRAPAQKVIAMAKVIEHCLDGGWETATIKKVMIHAHDKGLHLSGAVMERSLRELEGDVERPEQFVDRSPDL